MIDVCVFEAANKLGMAFNAKKSTIIRVGKAEFDAGHFFWTRPDPAQSFYALPKSKNCNAILID